MAIKCKDGVHIIADTSLLSAWCAAYYACVPACGTGCCLLRAAPRTRPARLREVRAVACCTMRHVLGLRACVRSGLLLAARCAAH
eukprot:356134-Chlamydomonas_euryale.AAC.4